MANQGEEQGAPYPPPAFYFRVVIGGDESGDNSFQEVSGLNAELETEDVAEGGENRFTHRLPKAIKHPKLVLKRGIADSDSTLVSWCKDVLESDFSASFTTKEIKVYLLDEAGDPLRGWSMDNALPVNWEIEPFNSTKNEVAIEKIEINYNKLERIV